MDRGLANLQPLGGFVASLHPRLPVSNGLLSACRMVMKILYHACHVGDA
jgi:hypothetical protein